jgi:hypothetical protein
MAANTAELFREGDEGESWAGGDWPEEDEEESFDSLAEEEEEVEVEADDMGDANNAEGRWRSPGHCE